MNIIQTLKYILILLGSLVLGRFLLGLANEVPDIFTTPIELFAFASFCITIMTISAFQEGFYFPLGLIGGIIDIFVDEYTKNRMRKFLFFLFMYLGIIVLITATLWLFVSTIIYI